MSLRIKYKRLSPNGTSRKFAVSYLELGRGTFRLDDREARDLYRQLAEVWGDDDRSVAENGGNFGECN